MGKPTRRWTAKPRDRVSDAARRNPDSPTARSGFDEWAQEAAGRNEAEDDWSGDRARA